MSETQPFSNAKAFFEDIRKQADPFKFLADIPTRIDTEPFFEEEWIDFKGIPLSSDIKKIWSKALSGYANITDGLIIWGIDTRKTEPRNIDAASGLRLISDPSAFESQLRDLVRDATNPPIIGIEYQSYADAITGEGFVVCLIPESRYKPHRAEFADQHYYYRAGDDFLRADPSLLRTLFYPQMHIYLWVEVALHYQLKSSDSVHTYRTDQNDTFAYNKFINGTSALEFEVILHNTGTVTARDIYIVVQASDELNYNQYTDWDIRKNIQGQAAFQARRPFHPGEISKLFSASFQKTFYNTSKSNEWGITPHFEKEHLRFLIYAENSQMQEIRVEFTPEDLNYETASATKNGYPIEKS